MSAKWLFWFFLPFVVIFVLAFVLSQNEDIPLGDLTRGVIHVTRGEWYEGVLSSTAILFWQSATTICVFMALLLRQNRPLALFFGGAAGLTLLLQLDDFLGIHERFGMAQKLFFAAYAFAAGLYVLVFFRQILQTDYLLLGLALFFFGMSVGEDVIDWGTSISLTMHYLVEDGFKFLGIYAWFGYYAWTAYQLLHNKPVAQSA